MPWIDDVVTHTTIRSVWGNTIRDHVVQVFTDAAERAANVSKMIEGDLCYAIAQGELSVRRAGAPNGFFTLTHPLLSWTTTIVMGGTVMPTVTDYAQYRRRDADTIEAWVVAHTTGAQRLNEDLSFALPGAATAGIAAAAGVIGEGQAGGYNSATGIVRMTADPARVNIIDATTNLPYQAKGAGDVTIRAHFTYPVTAA